MSTEKPLPCAPRLRNLLIHTPAGLRINHPGVIYPPDAPRQACAPTAPAGYITARQLSAETGLKIRTVRRCCQTLAVPVTSARGLQNYYPPAAARRCLRPAVTLRRRTIPAGYIGSAAAARSLNCSRAMFMTKLAHLCRNRILGISPSGRHAYYYDPAEIDQLAGTLRQKRIAAARRLLAHT